MKTKSSKRLESAVDLQFARGSSFVSESEESQISPFRGALHFAHSSPMACAGLACCGCSRSFWRGQADFDGYNLLSQKQFDPHWVLPRTSVEPDPRSRFYDADDRDRTCLCHPTTPPRQPVHGMG